MSNQTPDGSAPADYDVNAELAAFGHTLHLSSDDTEATSPSLEELGMSREEYECALQFEKDVRMARSLMLANLSDAEVIEAIRLEEEGHDPASDDEDEAQTRAAQARPATDRIATLSKLAGAYISPEAGKILLAQHEGTQGLDTKVRNLTCTACGDSKSYYEVMRSACNHAYCRSCVKEHFEAALQDESMFPPRCCRIQFSIDSSRIFLNPSILKTFEEKRIEYGTADRIYCSNKTCSAFIPPQSYVNESHRAVCPKCSTHTCTDCKQAEHADTPCKTDEETQAVLDLAEGEGWRRCSHCQNMVELNTGCNHITCKCGNEFCYVCGATPWKTCTCPQWQEDMLYDRAERVLQRQGLDEAIGVEERNALREEIEVVLEENHDCTHNNFRRVHGPHECDECHDWLRSFIFRCQQCHIDMCARCRFNRVR